MDVELLGLRVVEVAGALVFPGTFNAVARRAFSFVLACLVFAEEEAVDVRNEDLGFSPVDAVRRTCGLGPLA